MKKVLIKKAICKQKNCKYGQALGGYNEFFSLHLHWHYLLALYDL